MHAKITVNRKTRKIFKYSMKSLQNDARGPTYFASFTPIHLHLKPTNSRDELCKDFTMQVNSAKFGPGMFGPNTRGGGANTAGDSGTFQCKKEEGTAKGEVCHKCSASAINQPVFLLATVARLPHYVLYFFFFL